MGTLRAVLIITAVVVFMTMLGMVFYKRVFNGIDDRTNRGLLGCRVKYVDSGGTSFGYVSREDPGNMLVLQNPWKKYETVPMAKKNVELIDKEDWEGIDTKTGNSIWDIESSESTIEMFEFNGISPRTCSQ